MKRTWGETDDCRGCRYWSELLRPEGRGARNERLCLSLDGPRKGEYTGPQQRCDAWASGHHGAIDTPGLPRACYAPPPADAKPSPEAAWPFPPRSKP